MKEQCAKEVIVLAEGQTYSGAPGIAFLLKVRGNRAASALVKAGGPISRFGYRWIASHRNSFVVKTATNILQQLAQRSESSRFRESS
jgi:predicted DCC family thiol-disulfide oxidoreductase YuxK